jgi:hypothetical protein
VLAGMQQTVGGTFVCKGRTTANKWSVVNTRGYVNVLDNVRDPKILFKTISTTV